MKPDPYSFTVCWDKDGTIVLTGNYLMGNEQAYQLGFTPNAARRLAAALIERCDNLEAHMADNYRRMKARMDEDRRRQEEG